MSLETRSNSALFKRAEQLKRWEESDTNREPVSPRERIRRVNFSAGCVFLAACAAGDKDEVLKLLDDGADINTANVDGLTALHQACIDDNLDMVEFLVEHGADVNRGDNEGWTPLHATASCGFMYIAKYLIEKGADVAAVNTDGELAIDIAECKKMEDLLKEEIHKRGIDCTAARIDEEVAMLRDAKEWLATENDQVNQPHTKTKATPLHVAAAKGYVDVIKILLQCGADIDAQDVDGWSPIHAAAHWGQVEACQLLVENLADLDAKNAAGQTAFDLADSDMLAVLDDLKQKQNKEEVNKRKAKKRVESNNQPIESQVKKVKVEIKEEKPKEAAMDVGDSESDSESIESEATSSDTDVKKIEPEVKIEPVTTTTTQEDNAPWRPPIKPKQDIDPIPSNLKDLNVINENDVTLRRTKSFQHDVPFYTKLRALQARIQANNDTAIISSYNTSSAGRPKSDIILTNTAESHYSNKPSLPPKVVSPPPPTSPPPTIGSQSGPRSGLKLNLVSPTTVNGSSTPPPSSATTTPTNQGASSATAGSSTPSGNTRFQMFKNFFKSFVPPVRDEESETQRKAHAKRVRETRRSTQGVTLEEIKTAEQLVKLKNQPTKGDDEPTVNVSVTISTATPTVITKTPTDIILSKPLEQTTSNGELNAPNNTESHERRPSWRLKVDGSSKFKLEDATKPESSAIIPATPSYVRRLKPPESPAIETAEATVTIPLRRAAKIEEKDQENKENNDARNNVAAQATLATQAAIQRRRRPKRRSTGVVNFDNVDDVVDQEKDPAGGGGGGDVADQPTSKYVHESGAESRTSSRSRLDIRNENGEIDYKKLYEEQLVENDRLKDKLRKSDEELRETKQTLERLNVVTSKNSLSELEKRERRAMERKLSEMEEELKQLQKLKAENERLKADNRSLTRVINKLTNSAKK